MEAQKLYEVKYTNNNGKQKTLIITTEAEVKQAINKKNFELNSLRFLDLDYSKKYRFVSCLNTPSSHWNFTGSGKDFNVSLTKKDFDSLTNGNLFFVSKNKKEMLSFIDSWTRARDTASQFIIKIINPDNSSYELSSFFVKENETVQSVINKVINNTINIRDFSFKKNR